MIKIGNERSHNNKYYSILFYGFLVDPSDEKNVLCLLQNYEDSKVGVDFYGRSNSRKMFVYASESLKVVSGDETKEIESIVRPVIWDKHLEDVQRDYAFKDVSSIGWYLVLKESI